MRDKDEKHIEYLYRTHVDGLIGFAKGLGFDDDTCMDAIHDVFCRLCTDMSLIYSANDIRAYLFQAVRNRLFDVFKTNHLTSATPDELDSVPPFAVKSSVEDDFIENEEQEQLVAKVNSMLSLLTARQREIIFLRYEHELDYKDISTVMNINETSCRKLVHKAIVKLRENFSEK